MGEIEVAYLMEGGAPAGISILPASVGCRTKRSSINITIKQGKSRTRPRGIEMREFSLRRMRRRKKANLGVIFSALLDRSSYEGSFCAVGSRLRTSWRKFMLYRGSSGCYADAKLYRARVEDLSSRIELAMRYAAFRSCFGLVESDRQAGRDGADVAVQGEVDRCALTGRMGRILEAESEIPAGRDSICRSV